MGGAPVEGTILGGRYRVRSVLGTGGSASVYEGVDLTFGRTVALKIPHENIGPSSVPAKRLVREARASGAVGHPNVCQVSEIGSLPNGTPFVVMERLVGETLRDRLSNEGPLPFGDVIDVMMQVLSGLGAAHEHGIIHRDIKPENIFLSRRAGCPALVKILDFGLVNTDELSNEELTAVGTVVGTPYYLAPEQVRGVRDVDPRLDLYACGIVLYEATTGRRPFTSGNIAGLFQQILAASPRPVSELRRDTPPGLSEVIRRAMAPSLTARYAHTSAFQRALEAIDVPPPTRSSLPAFKAAGKAAAPVPVLSVEITRAESNVEIPLPRPPSRADDRTVFDVEIDVTSADDWDQQTEWDQPTLKNPPKPGRR